MIRRRVLKKAYLVKGTKQISGQFCGGFWLRWLNASCESIRANRFEKKKPAFITCERFARIALNLRVAFFSEDFSLLVAFLLVTFSWLFRAFSRGFFVALFCLEKQCSGLFCYFFRGFFRGFFVAPVLGKFYAYSPWNSLLIFSPPRNPIRKKKGSIREPLSDLRESNDSRESANRFARIGPSKMFWSKFDNANPLEYIENRNLLKLRSLDSSCLRGRQMGDGMGGGRNGCFWGAPILHLFMEKCFIFQGFGQKLGRPKNGRSYHHPSHPPLDALWLSMFPKRQ